MKKQRERKIRREGMIPIIEDLMRYAALAEKVHTQLERISSFEYISLEEQLMENIQITSTARDICFDFPDYYKPLINLLYEKINRLVTVAQMGLDSRAREILI